jgi:hypothetical protein
MRAVPAMTEKNARAWGWKAVSLASGAAAGMAAERIVSVVWKLVAPTPPPPDDADRSIPWAQAVAWGAAVGLGAGVARVVAHRSAAVAWEAATSEPPPVTTT